MKIRYKNTNLQLFIDNKLFDYDINKDIDIGQLRVLFNSSTVNLSQKYNSLEYWTMRISESNTLIHHLFLDVCMIELINKLLDKHKDIEIYTQDK